MTGITRTIFTMIVPTRTLWKAKSTSLHLHEANDRRVTSTATTGTTPGLATVRASRRLSVPPSRARSLPLPPLILSLSQEDFLKEYWWLILMTHPLSLSRILLQEDYSYSLSRIPFAFCFDAVLIYRAFAIINPPILNDAHYFVLMPWWYTKWRTLFCFDAVMIY